VSFPWVSRYNGVDALRVSGFACVNKEKDGYMKWCARLLGVSLFVALYVVAPYVHAGFGITPPYVRNDKLTQGSEFTQEITLVRGDPIEDLKAELTLNVPGAESWITIDRGTEFLLPKGEKQVPIEVTVRVPANAEYKQYTGSIRIRTVSPDPASGVSIALGAQVDVDLRVVDEVRDFEVKRVRLSEVEEARRFWWLDFPGKITFTMGIENTGNAPTAPAKVQLDIYDKRGTIVLETTVNTNAIEQVRPFETREVVAYLPTRLPPGAYLVKYSIFQFSDTVKRTGELTLSVLPRGTLAGYVGYGFDGLSRGDLLSVALPIGAVILLLLLTVFVSHRRVRRVQRRRNRTPPSDAASDAPRASREHPSMRRAAPGGVVDLSRRRT